jgi:hypothetical protein
MRKGQSEELLMEMLCNDTPRSKQKRRSITRRNRTSTLLLSLLQILLFSSIHCALFVSALVPSNLQSNTWHSRRRAAVSFVHNDANEVAPSAETVNKVHEFVETVQQSLDNDTFVSLLFKGPSISKKQRQDAETKERLRGCIRLASGRRIALRQKIMLQTTIKYHGATDVAKNYEMNQVVSALTSLLLLTDENVTSSEWGSEALHPCGTPLGIQRGLLETTGGTWELISIPTKPIRLQFKQATNSSAKEVVNGALSHDREKKVLLPKAAPFLQALGLVKPNGTPRPAMKSKLKQCQKFTEIVSGLIDSCMATRQDSPKIKVLDMGCGRSYLTFSLHSYLYQQYGNKVESCGIDVRPKLVKEITGIANSLGPEFDGLDFCEGTIEQQVMSSPAILENKDKSPLNVLIALHACDTATDDALWWGIQNQSNVIVVAPCCHKQVRRQLDRHVAKVKADHPLADVLCHNIYRERIAETVTDSLRALLLELANYNVQVFEFIGGEHTSKNVMITAVQRHRLQSEKERAVLRKRIRDLASLHGIQHQKLAEWMGEGLDTDAITGKQPPAQRVLSTRNMPPL